MRRSGFLAAGILAILLAVPAIPAAAQITRNTIDPVAELSPSGRYVTVTGPIQCGVGETLRLSAIVTQGGVRATGTTQFACTGREQAWSVYTSTGAYWATFDEGDADACAFALLRDGRRIVDVRFWCAANGVELVQGI